MPRQLEQALSRLALADQAVVMKVLDACAEWFDLDVAALRGLGRARPEVACRRVAMFLLNERLGLSSTVTAGLVNRDHSTVLHAVDVVRAGDGDATVHHAIRHLETELASVLPSLGRPAVGSTMAAMSKEDLIARVTNDTAYHPPSSPAVVAAHDRVRVLLRETMIEVILLVPEGRDLELALTALEEAMHWSNAGIAKTQLQG